jgi:hypothetical protein
VDQAQIIPGHADRLDMVGVDECLGLKCEALEVSLVALPEARKSYEVEGSGVVAGVGG